MTKSKSFDLLYMKALKSAAKATRVYDEGKQRRRVLDDIRPTIKQRAMWQTTPMAKAGGSHVFVKYDNKHARPYRRGHTPSRQGEMIYQLSKADIRKWEKVDNDPTYLGIRIGKPVFERFQGAWHHYPHETYGRDSGVSIVTAAGDIVYHYTLNYDDYGPYGIKEAMQAKLAAKPNDMRHYKALLKESKKTGLPTDYVADLTEHDKRSLTHRDPKLPFGWLLRDSGTNLVFPESLFDKETPGAFVDMVSRSYSSSTGTMAFYAWDGVSLAKKTPDAMKEWLDREYRKANR